MKRNPTSTSGTTGESIVTLENSETEVPDYRKGKRNINGNKE